MSFISTGFRELTLKVRRQRTRMALRHEKRHLQKSEIALGREGTAEAANFPEVRNEIVALKKLEQEQREVAVRIAKIEEALKQIEAQRQENSREQATALDKLEEEKRPLVERRNQAKSAAERCESELAAIDRRLKENEAADRELLKKVSALQATEPPPPDLQAQMERLSTERARLPQEKAEMEQARLGSADASRSAREKLSSEEALVAQADKKIAKARAEFEARDRTLKESARAQQEEVRQAQQQHQTVEEKKNPAYLNIGRHLASQGIAPPNAPHLLTEVQKHRAAVEHHAGTQRGVGPALRPDRQAGIAEVLFRDFLRPRPARDHFAARFAIADETRMAPGRKHPPSFPSMCISSTRERCQIAGAKSSPRPGKRSRPVSSVKPRAHRSSTSPRMQPA